MIRIVNKNIQRLHLLCMAVGLAAGCSETNELPAFSLSGRVTDSGTQESLSGVTVTLFQKSNNSRGESRQYANQTTGNGGEYRFDGLPRDVTSWSLTATVPGYYDYNESITITNRDGRNTQDIQMTLILSLTVSPASLNFTSAAGSHTFSVASNTSWTVEKSLAWLTVSPASGSGNGTVTVTIAANTSGSPRTGIINVTGSGITRTVAVTQTDENRTTFNDGSGTQSDPYLISSKADMEMFASKVNDGERYSGKYFRLTRSLTGTNALTTSVGTSNGSKYFAGIFDGSGYEIELNNAPNGVFGYLSGATVQNLGVIGKVSSNHQYVGGICGYVSFFSTVISCYNMASISSSYTGSVSVGGICGTLYGVTITNCFNTGTVLATSSTSSCHAGGICGFLLGGNILNCYNTGNVSAVSQASNEYYPQAGGISGYLSYVDTSIKYCFSANESIAAKYGISRLSAPRVGRIAGYLSRKTELGNNYASSIMILNDNNIISSDASDINGAGTSLSNFKSQSWIQNNLGWDFNTVWKMTADQYPTLRMSNN